VIHVERKGAGNEIQLEVNGKAIEGTVIPLPRPGTQEIQIVVRMT
jgi:hypothetical protein